MSQAGDQVRLTFAFDGVTDNGELILGEGDVVTLTNTDVGEGWYEGQTSSGQIGLFPISYCEAYDGGGVVAPAQNTYQEPPLQQEYDDDNNDDDWDDWQNNYSQQPAAAASAATPAYGSDQIDSQSAPTYSQQTSTVSQDDTSPKKNAKATGGGGGGIFGKSLFSSFTSSPASAYVGGECKADVSAIPKVSIEQSDEGPYWIANDNPFHCTVSDPTKSSKFSGLKSFIAYNITTTHANKTVSRRYKHFDWLYEQLSRKYGCVIAIPPLPDKQITGRYEEEFIETRRRQLENWLNRMASHPVVLSCEVFQHFINSKDNEKAWKTGKRKAEHDSAVGAALYMTIEPPQLRLDLATEERRIESYGRFVKTFDDALKQSIQLGNENVKNFSGPYMKENQRLGQQFMAMSFAFNMDERQVAQPLTEAMKLAGTTYDNIAILYQNQPQKDWIPFLDRLHDYHGQLSCHPQILACAKSAIDKQKEVSKQQLEGKATLDDVDKATNRTEVVCFATQAEVNHLHNYRVGDFTEYMKNFLEQQRAFHLEIAAKIEESLNAFNALS